MDKSRRVEAGANSSEVARFSLWFNSINFCFFEVVVTTDAKKADNLNTDVADVEKPSKGITDLEKADGAKVDRIEADEVDKPGTGIADPAKVNGAVVDRVEKPGTDITNLVEVDGADKLNTDPAVLADPVEVDEADKPDTGMADRTEVDGADKPNTNLANPVDSMEVDGANGPVTGTTTKDLQRQLAEKQPVER